MIFSPTQIKTLLSKYGVRPSKSLGQNFLIDQNILEKIIEASSIKKTETILEVGPGLGTLTQELAKNASRVIAVEKDSTMCEILKETLANYKNIEVINANILQTPGVCKENYKVVANIPYYLTSPLIRLFLEAETPPEYMVLMVQKEVAQRITAKPPEMSLLAVSVQFYADAKIEFYVSKNCFWPTPKVDSAVIKITPKKDRLPMSIQPIQPELFFKIVKAGFSAPRKQLTGNLSKSLKLNKQEVLAWLLKNKIDPKQRAETLSIKDWINLSNSI